MSKQFVKIDKNFDLSRFNLDLSKELNLAGSIVIKDMVDKNRKGLGVNGSALLPLDPKTVLAKKRRGSKQPHRALFDSGLMVGKGSTKGVGGRGLFLAKRAKKTKQEAVISVGAKRQEIGQYHNEGDGQPKREWFGVSKGANKNIIRMIELRIEELLRNV
tara:strand:+ start:336 stop:815 length:480 start_codon:yes stop_codon:yes gene_type:complete